MRIAVTGASGYLGGQIVDHLRGEGHEVLPLSRAGVDGPPFSLGEPFPAASLRGVSVVVHAAWDFAARDDEVRTRNVGGALPLLDAAASEGARIVHISSLSAHHGCRSRYGAAKLALEELVALRGGCSLRPGLVYGPTLGGLFGTIAGAVGRLPALPVPTARRVSRIFLSDDRTLSAVVLALATTGVVPEGPVFAAHASPLTLTSLVRRIAAARGRHVATVPLPCATTYHLLHLLEAAGLRPGFRADSLLAIADPVPISELARLSPSPVAFGELDFAATLGPSARPPTAR